MNTGKLMLDTNIVSYLLKKNARIRPYLRHFEGKRLFLPFVSVGELLFWAEDARWGRHAELIWKHGSAIILSFHTIMR